MRLPPLRVLLAAPVAAAVVLAAGLTWLGSVASRTLRERDDAVREGILLRLGGELVGLLREVGPDDAATAVEGFLATHGRTVAGIEIVTPRGVLVARGRVEGRASEVSAMLGPRWRGLAGGAGREFGPGRELGPAHEGGPGRDAGPGWQTALRLRLYPAEGLGTSGALPSAIMAGAIVVSLCLVAFSLLAVAGLAQRQRLAAAEGEQRRLEALALAGAGLAHRIRNPLAGIKGTTQLLLEGAAPPLATRAERILAATERIDTLLARLLTFARPPEANPQEVDLAEVAGRVAARTGGAVRVTATEAVSAWADEEHVESVVEELLANARAFDPEGELDVEVRRAGRHAVVEVSDRGPGLAVEPERAFDPYVTTRPEGTGLGLAIVRALARASGGDVTLAPRRGGGTVARLTVPAARR